MRLVFDLPDWADERHIYILAGVEMVAYKLYGEETIHIKKTRCNQCGQCCEGLTRWYFPLTDERACGYLHRLPDHTECELGIGRPMVCCTGLQQKGKYGNHPKCSVEYEEKPI